MQTVSLLPRDEVDNVLNELDNLLQDAYSWVWCWSRFRGRLRGWLWRWFWLNLLNHIPLVKTISDLFRERILGQEVGGVELLVIDLAVDDNLLASFVLIHALSSVHSAVVKVPEIGWV